MKFIHATSFISVFIFLIMGLLGAVLAYFTVTAVSHQNEISTTSMNIALSDSDEQDRTAITHSWGASGLTADSVLREDSITITNNGDVPADHVDISFSYTGDENVAKNLIFGSANHGFRYGGTTDADTVNLLTALKGGTDVDFIVTQGSNGQAFTASTVDGCDGSVKDGLISLHELSTFGKIRIQAGEESLGLGKGSSAKLWLNAYIGPDLTAQNAKVDVKITFDLQQNAQQF